MHDGDIYATISGVHTPVRQYVSTTTCECVLVSARLSSGFRESKPSIFSVSIGGIGSTS